MLNPNSNLVIHRWTKQAIDSDFPEAITLEQLINQVQEKLRATGEVVCEIVVNGMHISESDESKFKGAKVSEISDLLIKSSQPLVLLNDSLKSVMEMCLGLITVVETSGRLFRESDITKAHSHYLGCAEAMHWFCQLVDNFAAAHSALIGPVPPWFSKISKQIEFRLKEVLDAFINRNYILVADILEHEFAAEFVEWAELIQSDMNLPGGQAPESSVKPEVEGAAPA